MPASPIAARRPHADFHALSIAGILVTLSSSALAQTCPDLGVPIAGRPNWDERVLQSLTNAARISPTGYAGTILGTTTIMNSYPATPPLFWNDTAAGVCRAFVTDVTTNCPGSIPTHNNCNGTLHPTTPLAAAGLCRLLQRPCRRLRRATIPRRSSTSCSAKLQTHLIPPKPHDRPPPRRPARRHADHHRHRVTPWPPAARSPTSTTWTSRASLHNPARVRPGSIRLAPRPPDDPRPLRQLLRPGQPPRPSRPAYSWTMSPTLLAVACRCRGAPTNSLWPAPASAAATTLSSKTAAARPTATPARATCAPLATAAPSRTGPPGSSSTRSTMTSRARPTRRSSSSSRTTPAPQSICRSSPSNCGTAPPTRST